VFVDAPAVARLCNNSDSPNQDVRENYEIRVHNQRYTQIKTEKIDFQLSFKETQEQRDLIDHVNVIIKTLENVMHGITQSVHRNSICRLVLMSPSLDPAVNFPTLPVSEMASQLIFSHISAVLQSHQELDMNQLIGHLILTQPPGEGGGTNSRQRSGVNNRNTLSIRKWCLLSRNLLDAGDSGRDQLCGLRALMGALKLKENNTIPKDYMTKHLKLVRMKARKLRMKGPLSPEDLGEVVRNDGDFAGCQLNVYSTSLGRKRVYRSEHAAANQLDLLLEGRHYYVIKDVALFLGTKYYCHECDTGFNKVQNHKNCTQERASYCKLCHKSGCANRESAPSTASKIPCRECNRTFFTQECFHFHERANICDTSYFCQDCEKFCYRKNVHRCGIGYCRMCEKDMPLGHQFCYLKELDDSQPDKPPTMYVFYDLETSIIEPVQKAMACFSQEGTDPTTFQKRFGPECIDQWLREYIWPLAAANRKKGLDKTICVAHNSSGFDGWFILKWFYKNDVKVSITLRNNRLLQLSYRPLRLYFKDSLAFIPVPLSEFSSTFGLREEKGWYPHKLTTWENLQMEASLFPPGVFPPLDAFLPYEQKPKKYLELVEWHAGMTEKFRAENLSYNLREEMDRYCESDVKLLAEGVTVFIRKFQEMNFGFDPFRDNCTNSSSGLACFRTFYYDQKNLPVLLMGENSLKRPPRKSRIADAWLAFVEKSLGRPLAREYTIGRYVADACDVTAGVAYEFYGCVWHGCPTCRKDSREKCPVSGKTMGVLRRERKDRKDYILRMGWGLVEKWECHFREEIDSNLELRQFLSSRTQCYHKDINARDAMFGGRTSYFSHFFSCGQNQRIAFKDFVSLYPYQMIRKKYPVGEPVVINENFGPLDQYWGLVKCVVLPPRGEFIGVLPYHADGRLVFPLCATCAEQCWQEAKCPHSDQERQFQGTFTSFELEAALQAGYRITHLCQIWHWPEEKRSNQIFAPYLKKMLGEKMRSKALSKNWSPEKKQLFVDKLNKTYGFSLTPEDFGDNPGMKLVAKIFLNCFWGRFCLNTSGSEFTMVEGYENIWKKLTDPNVIVQDFAPVSETKMVMSYKAAAEKAMDRPTVSLLVGIFTCSYGRVDLLRAMQKVVSRVGNESLLYCDTDSVIHVENLDEPEILPVGEDLGDLSSEVPDGHRIVRFCCAAPKVYVLEIKKPDGSSEFRQKFKGFPNTFRSSQTLNGELFLKKFLEDYEQLQIKVKLEHRLRKNKWTAEINTVSEEKRLKFVSKKRVHQKNHYITYPFGYA
jgi:hypothetical protein